MTAPSPGVDVDSIGPEQHAQLLPDCGRDSGFEDVPHPALTARQAQSLFISHTLTTWNARTYEFAAILFTAYAFPDTLLWSSVRGITTTLSALLFSSAVGRAIGLSEYRLQPFLVSIAVNRASIICACLAWGFLLQRVDGGAIPSSDAGRAFAFVFVLLMGVFERLSSIANTLSSERDWVPTIADDEGRYSLTRLNAIMRRIDLLCKLVSPLLIAAIASNLGILRATWTVAGLNICSWGIEVVAAISVWRANGRLRQPRARTIQDAEVDERRSSRGWLQSVRLQFKQLKDYFSSSLWMPSIALSLLHFSALSYAATFLTYLLDVGFSLPLITVARTIGSVVEVSSTIVAPFAIHFLSSNVSPAAGHIASQLAGPSPLQSSRVAHGVGLTRCGLWALMLQVSSLIPVALTIWNISAMKDPLDDPSRPPTLLPGFASTATLFGFLSLSRLGLWIFDLCVQEIAQNGVARDQQASFGGTEAAFVSLFELMQWIAAASLSEANDFRFLAAASLGAVALSLMLYTAWVRLRRGHLIHWEKLSEHCACAKGWPPEALTEMDHLGTFRRL